METNLALTIIGSVLCLVGILFFLIPEKVNEKVMTDLSDSAIQPAAALRTAAARRKPAVCKHLVTYLTQGTDDLSQSLRGRRPCLPLEDGF